MKSDPTSFLMYPVESKLGRLGSHGAPVTRAEMLEQSALAVGKFAGSCPYTLP
jgi:hypothetical protein